MSWRERCIKYMIKGTGIKVDKKEHANKQIDTLIKYHNMSTKQLAIKVNLPEKIVKRFKKQYSQRNKVIPLKGLK